MPAPAAGAAERSEVPLICFTVLAPAAAGASLFALPLSGGWALAAVVVLMVTAGMLASIAHLARPLRAPRSLAHLGSSWLSREILAVSAFWALAALWLVCELGGALALGGAVGAASAGGAAGEPVAGALAAGGGAAGGAAATVFPWPAAARGFHIAAVVVGIVLLWVIARAYRVHGQPAWDGSDTFWELAAGALGSGGTVAAAVAAGRGDRGRWPALPGIDLRLLLGGDARARRDPCYLCGMPGHGLCASSARHPSRRPCRNGGRAACPCRLRRPCAARLRAARLHGPRLPCRRLRTCCVRGGVPARRGCHGGSARRRRARALRDLGACRPSVYPQSLLLSGSTRPLRCFSAAVRASSRRTAQYSRFQPRSIILDGIMPFWAVRVVGSAQNDAFLSTF